MTKSTTKKKYDAKEKKEFSQNSEKKPVKEEIKWIEERFSELFFFQFCSFEKLQLLNTKYGQLKELDFSPTTSS
jgi:hypothetical protein